MNKLSGIPLFEHVVTQDNVQLVFKEVCAHNATRQYHVVMNLYNSIRYQQSVLIPDNTVYPRQ